MSKATIQQSLYLERVYIAKEKAAMKEKMEREKLQEYAREQETWENR